MRSTLACMLVLAAIPAAAGPRAQRKPATDQYPPQVLETFVEAVVADKAGDLETAGHRYESALRSSPQANTAYNLADVLRRMEKYKNAIESYKKYLELAPNAPDRKEVERLIAELASAPSSLVIDGEDLDAVVFVDGKLLGASPQLLQPGAGKHHVDRIGPSTFVHRMVTLEPLHNEHVAAYASSGGPGNVVLSSNLGSTLGWTDQDHRFEIPGRFTLPPGHYETQLGGASDHGRCPPLSFDVPTNPSDVAYVFVDGPERRPSAGCRPFKAHAQIIHLPAAAP